MIIYYQLSSQSNIQYMEIMNYRHIQIFNMQCNIGKLTSEVTHQVSRL